MKQFRWLTPLMAVMMVAAFSAVLAHDGKDHDSKTIHGTVSTMHKNRIEIETPDGKTVKVGIDPETEYTRDGKEITKDAVKPGMRVAMEVTEMEHGGMLCHRLTLGTIMDGMHGMQGMHEGSDMHDMHQGGKEKKDPHRH